MREIYTRNEISPRKNAVYVGENRNMKVGM